MKNLYKFVIRYLKKNKTRTFSTILSIALASLLLFSVGFAFSTVRERNMQEIVTSTGDWDVHFRGISREKESVFYRDSIKKVIRWNENFDSWDCPIEEEEISICSGNFINIDINFEENFVLSEGRFPQNTSEVIISDWYKKKTKKPINTVIHAEEKDYTIVGYYRESKFVWNDNVDRRYYFTLWDDSETQPEIDYYVYFKKPKEAYKEIKQMASSELKLEMSSGASTWSEYAQVHTNDDLLHWKGAWEYYKLQDTYYAGLIIILFLLGLMTSFIIFHSFRISYNERKKDYGILKSLGVNQAKFFQMSMFEWLLLSLIGIPLGFFLSYFLLLGTSVYANQILAKASLLPFHICIYLDFFGITFLAILLVTFLSAILPAERLIGSIAIEDIQLSNDIKRKKPSKIETWMEKWMSKERQIARKSRKRNNGYYMVITITIIIGMIFFVSIGNTFQIITSALNTKREFYKYDLVINKSLGSTRAFQPEVFKEMEQYVEALRKEKGITEVHYVQEYIFKRENEDGTLSYFGGEYAVLEEQEDKEIRKELSIGEDIAFEANYSWGQNAYTMKEELILNQNEPPKKPLEICEEQQNYQTGKCYYKGKDIYYINDVTFNPIVVNTGTTVISEKLLNQIKEVLPEGTSIDQSFSLYINMDGDSKTEERVEDLMSSYPAIEKAKSMLTFENIRNKTYPTRIIVQCSEWVMTVAIGLIYLIVSFHIVNIVSTSLFLRKKEFATLKSIGFSSKRLWKVFVSDIENIVVKSILIGTILSSIMTYLIKKTATIILVKEELINESIKYYLIFFLLILLLLGVSYGYSYWKIKRMNIIDSIRDENG